MTLANAQTSAFNSSQSWAGLIGTEKPSVEAEKQDPKRQLQLFSTGDSEQDGDNVTLKGNVKIIYKDITVTCDEATGNIKTKRFVLRGNIVCVGKGVDFKGEELTIDLESRFLTFPSGRTKLSREIVGDKLDGNIFIRGGKGSGTDDLFKITDTDCTTCELERPHYSISAGKLVIRPQRSLQMRNVKLRIGRRTIIALPYLSIPLNESLPRYLPEIGQSRDEGFYIKARFGLETRGEELWDLRVELMTKLGIGLGTTYDYKYKKSTGKFDLYGLVGKQGTLTFSQSHQQRVGSWDFNTDLRYSRQNYETSPETTTTSTKFGILNQGQFGSFRLGFSSTKTENGNFLNQSQNLTLQTSITTKNRFKLTTDSSLINSSTRGTSFSQDRKVLDFKLSAAQEFKSLSTELLYQRSVPIGQVTGFFSQTDITPQLTITTDSKRLLNTKWTAPLQFSYGEYIDPIKTGGINRLYFDMQATRKTFNSGRLKLDTNLRYRQGIYSDDTAQFVVDYGADLTYETKAKQSINFRYGYLRQQGFTPLSRDRQGRNDLLQFSYSGAFSKNWTHELTTGYDFWDSSRGGNPWQSVGIRSNYQNGETLKISTSILYDTFNRNWSTLRTDFDYKPTKGPRFQGGFRFDGAQHTFGAANLLIDGFKSGKTTTSILATYNGYSKRFDSRQARFIYDLHCAEAIFTITDQQTGFRNGTTFGFYIRLKAFPTATPFGVGTKGQSFGIGGQNF